LWNNQIITTTKNKKIMTTTTTLPIEFHVLDFGASFNIEGNFDAAAMMEDENGKIYEIIYICTLEFKAYIESIEFVDAEVDEEGFFSWLIEGSEEVKKEGIAFICFDYDILNHLNDFINSDYNTLSKTVKQ